MESGVVRMPILEGWGCMQLAWLGRGRKDSSYRAKICGVYLLAFPIIGRATMTGRDVTVDERQIAHLICARLKYDLYDFFRGVLGLLPVLFLV